MTLRELIQEWLEARSDYNGLSNPDIECGCTIEDLMPCDEPELDSCVCGHIVKLPSGSFKVVPGKKGSGADGEEPTWRDVFLFERWLRRKGVRFRFSPKISVQGNNGGDYLLLRKVSENSLFIEVGHCCVVTLQVIVPTEVITGLFSGLTEGCGFKEAVAKFLPWDEEFNEQIINKIEFPRKMSGGS